MVYVVQHQDIIRSLILNVALYCTNKTSQNNNNLTYIIIHRWTDFGRVCSKSTELHFPDLEDQLEAVRNTVPQVVQWRRDHPPPQYDCDEDAPVSLACGEMLQERERERDMYRERIASTDKAYSSLSSPNPQPTNLPCFT